MTAGLQDCGCEDERRMRTCYFAVTAATHVVSCSCLYPDSAIGREIGMMSRTAIGYDRPRPETRAVVPPGLGQHVMVAIDGRRKSYGIQFVARRIQQVYEHSYASPFPIGIRSEGINSPANLISRDKSLKRSSIRYPSTSSNPSSAIASSPSPFLMLL